MRILLLLYCSDVHIFAYSRNDAYVFRTTEVMHLHPKQWCKCILLQRYTVYLYSGEHVSYYLQWCMCIIVQLSVIHMHLFAICSHACALSYYCLIYVYCSTTSVNEHVAYTCYDVHVLMYHMYYTICNDAHVCILQLPFFNAHALLLAVIHVYPLTTCRDAQSFSNYLQWCTCAGFYWFFCSLFHRFSTESHRYLNPVVHQERHSNLPLCYCMCICCIYVPLSSSR
jgi:hypothetical protein